MQAWTAGLKAFSWVVVVLMVLAILYGVVISLRNWSHIAV